MSIAGKIRFSEFFDQDELHVSVPLNSSKITRPSGSGSTRAVSRMSGCPTSSMLRAAPKNFSKGQRAGVDAAVRVRPVRVVRLYARASG